MIFRQMNEVRSGTKTQTRRLMKEGDYYSEVRGTLDRGMRRWLTVGCVRSVQPKMFQKSFGRIRITGIRVEHLQDITEADAIAEGITAVPLSQTLTPAYQTAALPGQTFPTARDCYFALWNSINTAKKYRADKNPLVWVITFEYVGDV